MTSYLSTFVSVTLSCTIFEMFDFEEYRDLEIWVRGHSLLQLYTRSYSYARSVHG